MATFRDPQVPLRWVAVFLVLGILLDAIAVVSDEAGFVSLSRIAGDISASAPETMDTETRQAVIGLLQLLFFVTTGGLFLWWFYIVYTNLSALGATNLRFRRGWAIGAWFVPILGLFRPKAMADDIWRASDPTLPAAQGQTWWGRPVPVLLHWWWAAFLVSNFLGNIVGQLALNAKTVADLRNVYLAYLAMDAISVTAGVLALLVVQATTDRQARRAAAIVRASSTLWA